MVGERGPEMVNLPAGSQVTPNHAMQGERLVASIEGGKFLVWLYKQKQDAGITGIYSL